VSGHPVASPAGLVSIVLGGGIECAASRRRRRAAVLAVKVVHSAIFLSVAASILHIFYAGVTNRTSRLTRIALALALGECAIFAANGFRCPLRTMAEGLGAESGQVTDIFLPRWFADRVPLIFTPPLVTGILALIWRRRRSSA
jgi:hypothetical protein